MSKPNKRLLKPAAHLSQNYLSLIVAVIVLACLSIIAGFVFAAHSLDSAQRWVFIGLLIVVPAVAAMVAVWLILQNVRRIKAQENDSVLDWHKMPAESQRRKLNLEIAELARIMTVPREQFAELHSAYIVAEDLALRRIEEDAQISLMRHVSIETAEFDAILIDENVVKCVEVTFLVTPNVSEEKIKAILRKLDLTKKLLARIRPGTKVVLLLALVTQFDKKSEQKLRSIIADRLAATPVDVDIRLFDFEELQKIYTAD